MGELQAQLGARIKQIRLARDLTQEDVAERANRSYKYIGQVERGAANPTVDVLENLAAALGVSIIDFFQGAPTYPLRQSEAPVVREVADSLEEMAAKLRRASGPPATSRSAKKR